MSYFSSLINLIFSFFLINLTTVLLMWLILSKNHVLIPLIFPLIFLFSIWSIFALLFPFFCSDASSLIFYVQNAWNIKYNNEKSPCKIAFILLRITENPQLKVLVFIFFLIYVLSVPGNFTIIILTLVDSHLKTLMYFFLQIFAFLEMQVSLDYMCTVFCYRIWTSTSW